VGGGERNLQRPNRFRHHWRRLVQSRKAALRGGGGTELLECFFPLAEAPGKIWNQMAKRKKEISLLERIPPSQPRNNLGDVPHTHGSPLLSDMLVFTCPPPPPPPPPPSSLSDREAGLRAFIIWPAGVGGTDGCPLVPREAAFGR